MDGFITAIASTLTADALWESLANVAPFIAAIVIFAFGYRVVRRVISGASKGKGRI